MNFDFISDNTFKGILERDYKDMDICYKNGAHKSVLVMAGSIIEAVLLDYFLQNLPLGKTEEQVYRMTLKDLIDLSYSSGLLQEKSKDLASVIRNYRNLIHPGKENRKKEHFDAETAAVSMSLVKIVLKEVSENQKKMYSYTSEDIIRKIENDSNAFSIFKNLVEKLNEAERNKLLVTLTEYEIVNQEITHYYDTPHISDPQTYLNLLKPFIKKEKIREQVNRLTQIVEIGNFNEAFIYFKLYHDDLNVVPDTQKELILVYFLSKFNSSSNVIEVFNNYFEQNLFSIFGMYINLEGVKREYFKLIHNIVINHSKSDYLYFGIFDQALYHLNEDKKLKVMEYVEKSINKYYSELFLKGYDNGDYLPF